MARRNPARSMDDRERLFWKGIALVQGEGAAVYGEERMDIGPMPIGHVAIG